MSIIRFGTIQKPNPRQMMHNSYIFININSWHTAYTIKLQNSKFVFFSLFVSSFPLFFLLLHQFFKRSGNSDKHIIFLVSRKLRKLSFLWYFKQTFGQFLKEADLLLKTFFILFPFLLQKFIYLFLNIFKSLIHKRNVFSKL